jgi:hypothetical protein
VVQQRKAVQMVSTSSALKRYMPTVSAIQPRTVSAAAADPHAAALARLDTLLQNVEEKNIAPLYRDLSRRLQTAFKSGGLPAMQKRFDQAIPKLLEKYGTTIEEGVTQGARMSGDAFLTGLRKQYGNRLESVLMQEVPASRMPHLTVPRVLENIGTGVPDDVAKRILTMPDRQGYTYSERLWRSQATTRQEMGGRRWAASWNSTCERATGQSATPKPCALLSWLIRPCRSTCNGSTAPGAA